MGNAATAPVVLSTQCCISGGGPAGMMLGFLLARAGVEVVVLEKHADFLRDFRGDTIHPSTLEVMAELGLLDDFLKLPHQEARTLSGQVGDFDVTIADFTHLPTRCKFIALMPQWDFLDFLAARARAYPNFRLLMQAQVDGLIEERGCVKGVTAATPDGRIEIRAGLVVGADGRHSTVRAAAGLIVEEIGAPMDVLWFRLPRAWDDSDQTGGKFDAGRIFVRINRGDYWQCGYVIAKGSIERIQAAGLDAFRRSIAHMAPFAADRVDAIRSWDDVKLLTVGVDRLDTWYRPGLLCIGDAAHTMSPVGGVGINLAIQDAVATANLLSGPLRDACCGLADLHAVQHRRELPTRLTQAAQVFVQKRVISRLLAGSEAISPPFVVRLLARFPFLRRIPARMVGIGVRPEHIRSPTATPPLRSSRQGKS